MPTDSHQPCIQLLELLARWQLRCSTIPRQDIRIFHTAWVMEQGDRHGAQGAMLRRCSIQILIRRWRVLCRYHLFLAHKGPDNRVIQVIRATLITTCRTLNNMLTDSSIVRLAKVPGVRTPIRRQAAVLPVVEGLRHTAVTAHLA